MYLIVSLVSEQTLPNVEFIQALPRADRYLFIETRETRLARRSRNIQRACGIPSHLATSILVDPNGLFNSQMDLERGLKDVDISLGDYLRIDVNLTGGTKMMALMAYDYFREYPGAALYYKPVRTMEAIGVGGIAKNRIPLPELNLETYLAAYGFYMIKRLKPEYPREKSETLFREVMKHQHPGKVQAIRDATQPGGSYPERAFFSGGWFPEWLYYSIHEQCKIPASNMAMSLEIKHGDPHTAVGSDNEIDVAFVHRNNLHLLEAKVYGGNISPSKIYGPMYKIAGIQRTLGLNAQTHVFFLHPFGQTDDRRRRVEARCKLLGIRSVWALEDMRSGSLDRLLQ